MVRLLIHWLLSAVALLVVSNLVPGFYVEGLGPALIAARPTRLVGSRSI